MKKYHFDIAAWQVDEIFAPVRSKTDVIRLLMKTLKIMATNQSLSAENVAGEIILNVSKMSRVFYFADNKYVSINFPFTVLDSDDGMIVTSDHIDEIDSMITSHVIRIINLSDSLESSCIYDFADPILKVVDDTAEFWSFFRELMLYEDGYIRYDYDDKRVDGRVHPLNHYDIFYSSNATFKIGLKKRIERDVMIDLLSLESDCHFIE